MIRIIMIIMIIIIRPGSGLVRPPARAAEGRGLGRRRAEA